MGGANTHTRSLNQGSSARTIANISNSSFSLISINIASSFRKSQRNNNQNLLPVFSFKCAIVILA